MNEIILEGRARFVAFTTDAREMAIIYWRAKRNQVMKLRGPLHVVIKLRVEGTHSSLHSNDSREAYSWSPGESLVYVLISWVETVRRGGGWEWKFIYDLHTDRQKEALGLQCWSP